ncbi:MAG: histidine--tRNA ligase [Alphaproteobacteria bacterium]|nr:histidine--tRNA ligase [Alphaproteobacteria bacterium]
MSTPIVKPASITGFPEYLPEERLLEQKILDTIRSVFESHGFCSIETPVVEKLDVLLSKSADTNKEMYVLGRLQAEEKEEAKMGLRYDLTVPFARYVAQHENDLVFPFKRYQIQPCWRGERPKLGRYRQFTQCDIDIIAREKLALEYDALVPAIVCEAWQKIGLNNIVLQISNRKILVGFVEGLGIKKVGETLRILDKLHKIGPDAVAEMLQELGLSDKQIKSCLSMVTINTSDLSFADKVRALGIKNETLELGLNELAECVKLYASFCSVPYRVDMSLVRGFDYYTGTIYEIQLLDTEFHESIGGGGRYDNLASTMTKTRLPGVGMSMGISRTLGVALKLGLLKTGAKSPADVLVVNVDAADKTKMLDVAAKLRERGIKTEVYLEGGKLAKQLKYANDKGISYVWFDIDSTVKNMQSGEQQVADVNTWLPEQK